MIKAIIFDIGGVLVKTTYEVLLEVLSNKSKVDKNIIKKFADKSFNKVMLGQINESQHFAEIIKQFNIPMSVNDIQKKANLMTEPKNDVWDIVHKLKKRHRLAILSDQGEEWAKVREKTFNFSKYFNPIVYSYKLKIRKPKKEIYEHVLKLLNLSEKECLFIDDSIKNIKGAKNVGMKTIHFKSADQLKKELKKLGIDI